MHRKRKLMDDNELDYYRHDIQCSNTCKSNKTQPQDSTGSSISRDSSMSSANPSSSFEENPPRCVFGFLENDICFSLTNFFFKFQITFHDILVFSTSIVSFLVVDQKSLDNCKRKFPTSIVHSSEIRRQRSRPMRTLRAPWYLTRLHPRPLPTAIASGRSLSKPT